MASLKTFYRGKEPNRPVAQFLIGCRGIFQSDSVGQSVAMKGQSDERRSVALPPSQSSDKPREKNFSVIVMIKNALRGIVS